MDRSRLLADDPQTEVVRQRFELNIATMELPGLPQPLVRKGPMHYEGPAWVSAMWFGFLLSARTTHVWRDPGFEGDFVKGDTIKQLGIILMDQDADSASTDMRVPAAWVADVMATLADHVVVDEESAKFERKAIALLGSQAARDAKK